METQVQKMLDDQRRRIEESVPKNNTPGKLLTDPAQHTQVSWADLVVGEMCAALNQGALNTPEVSYVKRYTINKVGIREDFPVWTQAGNSKKGFPCPICRKGNFMHLTPDTMTVGEEGQDLRTHILEIGDEVHAPKKIEYDPGGKGQSAILIMQERLEALEKANAELLRRVSKSE
jgi:hypothetical protein